MNNLIDEFHYEIRKIWLKKPRDYGVYGNVFYQTHPELSVIGQRPTMSRLKNYDLDRYFNDQFNALVVGCNTGFFDLMIAKNFNQIDSIDYDMDLISIANLTKRKLKNKNVNFININIMEFNTEQKYNFVFSMSVHKYLPIALVVYLNLLSELIIDDGFLFIESHPGESEINKLESAIKIMNFKEEKTGFSDDSMGMIRKYFLLKKDNL